MKNIKKNIFSIIMIVACMSGTENYCNHPEDIESLFAKMAAKQKQKAKRETAKLKAEARAAKVEAEMSAFQIELEVMPVETEELPREIDAETAENNFRKCLIKNRHSFALGKSKIPKVCEDFAKILRLLGGNFVADELIKAFQK